MPVRGDDGLYYQEIPWGERHFWLRDNLASFEEMQNYVFNTEEYIQTMNNIDQNLWKFKDNVYEKYECKPTFEEWLISYEVGGCYIQNFEAMDVLYWAVKETLDERGYMVDEDTSKYPYCHHIVPIQ